MSFDLTQLQIEDGAVADKDEDHVCVKGIYKKDTLELNSFAHRKDGACHKDEDQVRAEGFGQADNAGKLTHLSQF